MSTQRVSDTTENQGSGASAHANELRPEHEPFEARVTVNGKPVVLRRRRMTGLEIKQGAIEQGVGIEIGFVLHEELPNGHHKVIGDQDTIPVHDHDRFTAIPNDDNS